MTEQTLSDVKVVEWGSFISAPYCTKLMADMGAEVIKIETPGIGDDSRNYGPFFNDVPDSEASGLFLYLNTNKLGVTLDLSQQTGREMLLKLLKDADILVTNHTPRFMKKLKLDFNSLKKVNPNLIMTTITPYGLTGPYKDWKAYDLNICALGGITNAIGTPDREPITPPLSQGGYQSGLISAIATLMALFARDMTGKGLQIDIGEVECWATFHIGVAAQSFLEEGRVRRRSGNRALHRPFPDEVIACKDGSISIDLPQKRQWQRFLDLIGNPEWANDPIFEDRLKTADEYCDQADEYLKQWTMQHTKAEIFRMCQEKKVPCAPIRTMEEVVNDEHLKGRGYFVDIKHPKTGSLKYPGVGYKLSKTPFTARRPAPLLGEHNEEIYCRRLGLSKEELVALRRAEVI